MLIMRREYSPKDLSAMANNPRLLPFLVHNRSRNSFTFCLAAFTRHEIFDCGWQNRTIEAVLVEHAQNAGTVFTVAHRETPIDLDAPGLGAGDQLSPGHLLPLAAFEVITEAEDTNAILQRDVLKKNVEKAMKG
jgi:hypothetical protein